MIYYILIVLAALGCAANFAFTKVYQLEQGNTMEKGAIFNCLVGLVGFLIYFAACGFKMEITPFSVIIVALLTLFVGFYTIVGFKIMSIGSMAVYTIFVMLGGMVLPYFYGLIFLGEKITVLKTTALVMMIFAIILQNGGEGKKGTVLFYILCSIVFVLNGMTSVLSKIHQINTKYPVVSANGFVMLKNLLRFVLFGAMIPFVKKKDMNIFRMNMKTYISIIGAALVSSVAYVFQLICASYVPATVQFPVLSGGTIIFTALLGMIFFHEKINKKQVISLTVCTVATVLFVI